MKRTIPLLVGAAMLVTIPALAQGPGGFGPGPGMGMGPGHGFGMRGGCLMSALDLDSSQQAAWEEIQSKLHETMQGLAEQRRELFRQLQDALAATTPDPAAVGRLTISEHELGQKMRAAHEKARSDFAAVLRPDQQEKFQTLAELREECGGPRRFKGRAAGGGFRGRGAGDCPGCPFGPPPPEGSPSD